MAAFILSKVYYCDVVLAGLAKRDLDRLQSVINAAARLMTRACRYDHVTLLLCWKTYTLVACTWTNYIQVVRSRLQLSARFSATLPTRSHSACRWSHFTTSTAVIIFIRPAGAGTRRTILGDRAFTVAGPRAWKTSSPTVRHRTLSNSISRLIYSVYRFEHITTPYFMTV